MEIQLDVDAYGEEIVCPMIWCYCFEENGSVRTWYTLLGGRTQAFMTMDTGCWINFMHKMREIWSKPMAVAHKEAEDRPKLPGEGYHQYFFTKLKLLTGAFPESLAVMHISRIHSKFDADADKFIRERFSIAAFGKECREYDEHLKFHPVSRNRRRFEYPSPTGTNPALARTPVTGLNNTNPATAPQERKQITWPARFEKRTDNRIKMVMERVDVTTGKKACSFQRQDGTIKFIERPCDLCDRTGQKDQWHFSCECPTRDKMTAMISETIDSDSEAEANSENELPGVLKT